MANGSALGPRSALIIAAQSFEDERLSRLRSPAQDAKALEEVLADSDVGGFDTSVSIDETEAILRRRLAKFFDNRLRDELLLVYYAGHGILAPDRELFLAATDTELGALEATALSAQFVSRVMDRTRARQVVPFSTLATAAPFHAG